MSSQESPFGHNGHENNTERVVRLVATVHEGLRSGNGMRGAEVVGRRGTVIQKPLTDGIYSVETDSGVAFERWQDAATERMVGCTTVVIRGERSKAIIHLTPSSKLPYRGENLDATTKKIAEAALRADPQTLDTYDVVILSNIGNADKDSTYNYAQLEKDQQALQESLLRLGFDPYKMNVVQLPMENTTVVHTDDRPNELFVAGHPVSYNDRGGLDVHKTKIIDGWVPMDPRKEPSFDIEKPPLV